MFKLVDRERLKTPQDRSLWESLKVRKPARLAAMIDRQLQGTTATAVLAGAETWSRPWVRYEIARSLVRGNGLLTVFIDGCKCPREGFSYRGHNPLSFIALGWDNRIYELNANGVWVLYSKITETVTSWPKWLARPDRNYCMPLDVGTLAYDWISGNGRANLVHWTNLAAIAAGK